MLIPRSEGMEASRPLRTLGVGNRRNNPKRFPQDFRSVATEYLSNQPQRRRAACLDSSASPSSRLGPAAEKTNQAPGNEPPRRLAEESLEMLKRKRLIETPEAPPSRACYSTDGRALRFLLDKKRQNQISGAIRFGGADPPSSFPTRRMRSFIRSIRPSRRTSILGSAYSGGSSARSGGSSAR